MLKVNWVFHVAADTVVFVLLSSFLIVTQHFVTENSPEGINEFGKEVRR